MSDNESCDNQNYSGNESDYKPQNGQKTEKKIQKMKGIKKRTRERGQNSQYKHVCECGKKYMSHPALYQHKKNKHPDINNSKNKNQDPQSQQKQQKGGRPKKIENQIDYNKENIIEELSEEECEPIEGTLFYFRNLTGEIKFQKENFQNLIESQIQQDQKFQNKYPQSYQQVLETAKFLIQVDGPSYKEKILNQDFKNKSINFFLMCYVYELSPWINLNNLKESYEVLKLLIEVLNDCNSSVQQEAQQNEFCCLSNQGAQVINYIESYKQKLELQKDTYSKFQLLGNNTNTLKLQTIHFIKLFCNWLFINSFSNVNIEFKSIEIVDYQSNRFVKTNNSESRSFQSDENSAQSSQYEMNDEQNQQLQHQSQQNFIQNLQTQSQQHALL